MKCCKNSKFVDFLKGERMIDVQVVEEPKRKAVRFTELSDIADRATSYLHHVRERILAPHPRKHAPVFTLAQIAKLCGIEKSRANYILANKDEAPKGTEVGRNKKREFSLSEAQNWVKLFSKIEKKNSTADAYVWASGNFKGGVTKTTTALAIAQGLSLRGRKGLIIDLDPQGSMTSLFGILPDSEVSDAETVLPFISGEIDTLDYAIQETYWSGIDLIPACVNLFSAEFILPSRQASDSNYEFWDVLRKGIQPLLSKYDFIIFDTPPALSYLTINAFFAANGLVVPMPPSPLDFASSTQFWTLFSDLTGGIAERIPSLQDREYENLNILVTLSEQSTSASVVKDWIKDTYQDHVLKVEIPKAEGAKAAAAAFGTAYEVNQNNATFNRVREAYDSLAETIDNQMLAFWQKETV